MRKVPALIALLFAAGLVAASERSDVSLPVLVVALVLSTLAGIAVSVRRAR